MAHNFKDGFQDLSDVERVLYGDVDNDAELEAELLALEAEDAPPQVQRRPSPAAPKPVQPAAALRRAAPAAGLGSKPAVSTQGGAPFARIDKLAREISQEAEVPDDVNDASVDNDSDLLEELDGLLGVSPKPEVSSRSVGYSAAPPTSSAGPSVRAPPAIAALLQERLQMYTAAESAANAAGDAAKARRLNRGIKTLQSQLRSAKAGKPVNEDDIPPPCTVKASSPAKTEPRTAPHIKSEPDPEPLTPPPVPRRSVPETISKPSIEPEGDRFEPVLRPPPVKPKPKPQPRPVEERGDMVGEGDRSEIATLAENVPASVDARTLARLRQRQDEYKRASLAAKNAGDRPTAVRFFKIAKQFDALFEAIAAGRPVDLTDLPPSPFGDELTTKSKTEATLTSSSPTEKRSPPAADQPKMPTSVLEGLQQRLEKYRATGQKASEEGDERKARMMNRIAKQYQVAIRTHKAGKPLNLDDLPVPPGYPPLPTGGAPVMSGAGTAGRDQPPTPPAKPTLAVQPQKRSTDTGPRSPDTDFEPQKSLIGPSPPKQSRYEQQRQFLITRQLQFRKAALLAKQKGDLKTAKDLLRQAKGFDQMIEASAAGLPIDITRTPIPPQMTAPRAALRPQVPSSDVDLDRPMADVRIGERGGAKSSADDDEPKGWSMVQGGREEVFAQLEKDLIRQIQMCQQNQEYFTRLGEVRWVALFEKMATGCKKDLVATRNAFKLGDPAPRFHYETRTFPALHSCPDLGTDDLELGIVRALQNQEYFMRLGEVRWVALFEKMATGCKKDLVVMRNAFKLDDPPPHFHYETRTFPALHSCPNLGMDDLELGALQVGFLQIQMCQQNQEYFTRLGEVRWVALFEKMATGCKKDLVVTRNAFKLHDPPPHFHYETRTFPALHSCPNLGMDDLELGALQVCFLQIQMCQQNQ